jgi:hypothetical protein
MSSRVKENGMKAIVGYSATKLKDFAVEVDRIPELKEVSKMKVTGSFYKILLSDKRDLHEFAREAVSILCALVIALRYHERKYYGKSFQEIIIKRIIPLLNRGLYGQESIRDSLRNDSPDERITILGTAAIAQDKPETAIALLMILVGKDLEELLLTGDEMNEIFVKKGLLSKTFISMEDLKK